MDKPRIIANFELGDDGRPERVVTKDDLDHYRIRLFVDGAPPDTYAVTYVLHDSYLEPVREIRNPADGFAEELTSYGDYTVQAKIRTKHGVISVAVPLSSALSAGHRDKEPQAIADALRDIRRH